MNELLELGATLQCTYNKRIKGTVVGYGTIHEDTMHTYGGNGSICAVYLVQLDDDLIETKSLTMHRVRVIRVDHAERV